jgi:hypothetical protein
VGKDFLWGFNRAIMDMALEKLMDQVSRIGKTHQIKSLLQH